MILNGGDGVTPGTENVISNNTGVGVAVANSAEADISGDNRIIGNQGAFGLEVIHTSTVIMSDGTISSNAGGGVHCGETSHCEWAGATKISSNFKGGIEITDHSDAYIDGGMHVLDISDKANPSTAWAEIPSRTIRMMGLCSIRCPF